MVVIQKTSVPLNVSFHFFILESFIPFAAPRWKNECLRSVERKQAKKRKIWENNEKRKKKREEKKLQIIKEEVFRATKAIYIVPLASRLTTPTFQESNKNSIEERNVEREILEALQHVTTMGERLEETLQGLQQHFLPPTPTVIVINDLKKKNQVEKKTTKAKSDQLVEVEQLANVLLEPI